MDLRGLTDEALLARLEALVSGEREALGDILEHLAEVDRREIIPDRGYESLFTYCTKRLGYSEAAAFYRIRAARAIADFPEMLGQLRSGAISLESAVRVSPHLTAENKSEVLERACGASKRQVLALVADLRGWEPPRPDAIRPLARSCPAQSPLIVQARLTEVIPPPRRVRSEFEADDELVLIVERLKGLLAHRFPFGRLEDIFKEAAATLLADLDPGRAPPRTGRPRNATVRRRRIPSAVKRQVWQRDGGRCAFVAEDGRRCESRHALQYDHVTPWALGGPSDDPSNIRLLCRPHNLRLARKRFGPRSR